MSYGLRQFEAMRRNGSLCVGIDPHARLLRVWGLADDAAGLREFSLRLIEAVGPYVAAVKPQSAFYERHGSAGIAVLEEVLDAMRSMDILSILDVKRGDIGSTMEGYAQAYLSPDSPLRADAITVSPYLGPDSLLPTARFAAHHDRGLYFLGLTSNSEGPQIQHVGEPSVAKIVLDRVFDMNEAVSDTSPGPLGLVVGATVGDAAARLDIRLSSFNGLFLAPGLGAQGATAADLLAFGGARRRVLASVSRGVLGLGPGPDDLKSAVMAVNSQVRDTLSDS